MSGQDGTSNSPIFAAEKSGLPFLRRYTSTGICYQNYDRIPSFPHLPPVMCSAPCTRLPAWVLSAAYDKAGSEPAITLLFGLASGFP